MVWQSFTQIALCQSNVEELKNAIGTSKFWWMDFPKEIKVLASVHAWSRQYECTDRLWDSVQKLPCVSGSIDVLKLNRLCLKNG